MLYVETPNSTIECYNSTYCRQVVVSIGLRRATSN